jgi:hypothetical protein
VQNGGSARVLPDHFATHREAVHSSQRDANRRTRLSGQQILDCDQETFAAGCFGAAGCADISGLPDAAVRASVGCGNPVAALDGVREDRPRLVQLPELAVLADSSASWVRIA